MKKRALMALPKLTATDEMKKIATSDLPRKEKTGLRICSGSL